MSIDERRRGQRDRVTRAGVPVQRVHQRFRFHDASRRRPYRGVRGDVRFHPADKTPIDEFQIVDRVGQAMR